MSQELERFEALLTRGEKSSATRKKYLREGERLLAFLGGQEPTPELILQYKERIKGQRRPKAVNAALCAVNAYLRAIGREDCRVSLLRIQRRPFIEDRRELTQAEYVRLLGAARPGGRMCMVLQTLCATGIRVSELGYITVEAARAGRAEISLKGKCRVVLIVKALRQSLLRFAGERGIESGSIFRTRNGKPLDRRNIWRDMKRLAEGAGVDASKVFPHNLRHLFARAFYAVERNLANLADILGHSSVETTRIYVAASEREHERILERMELVLRI